MKQLELLKKIILSDRYNAMIFKIGEKHGVYLVGGYIRDLLRGIHAQDRDFIISKNVKAFLKKIRKNIPGKSITFSKGNVTRFVTRDSVSFDFSPIIGSLREDLSLRDFSINAIAWSPEEGILDFHKGLIDLRKKTLRTISEKNFLADPLRMLRAYRFAAEIDGRIEANTRKIIKTLHNNIQYSSPERITLELFNLLNQEHCSKYLKSAFKDGILNIIFPINSNTLKVNIQSICEFETALRTDSYRKFKEDLKNIFSQNLTYKGLLCLEMIVSDVPKLAISKLRMSRQIVKRLLLYSNGEELFRKNGINDPEKIFNLFYKAKEAANDLLLSYNILPLQEDYERYIKIWKGRNISTDWIQDLSGIDEGKKLGEMIYKMRKAEFKGEIQSITSARKYIMNNIQ